MASSKSPLALSVSRSLFHFLLLHTILGHKEVCLHPLVSVVIEFQWRRLASVVTGQWSLAMIAALSARRPLMALATELMALQLEIWLCSLLVSILHNVD